MSDSTQSGRVRSTDPPADSALLDYLASAETSETMRQAHLCGTGPVATLEKKLCQHYGKRHALCVTNATSGLLALALALDLQGSSFVTTPLTYGATLSGWLLRGNCPVFADVDPQTLTLCPDAVEAIIGPETEALLSVDLFGVPSEDAALRRVANEHGLWYIADAAQSLGARRAGRPASVQADALVVSFTAGKTLFAGEGGAILTDHDELYEKLVWHTQHPYRQKRDLGLSLNNEFALNMRMHPLAAVWAEAEFEPAMRQLRQHQEFCFNVIDRLESEGLIETVAYRSQNLYPSFFRLTAVWKEEPRPDGLEEVLQDAEVPVCLSPFPCELIYHQPSFLAQYENSLAKPPQCPVAEEQTVKRFCLTLNC